MFRKIIRSLCWFGLMFLLLIYSCNRGRQFVIKGQLENSKQVYIYLAEMNLTVMKIIDSAKINNNGSFKFKCKIDNPCFYQLLLDQSNFVILQAEPGQRIQLKADANNLSRNYKVEGSDGSLQIKTLTDYLFYTRRTLDSLERIIDNNITNKGFDTIYKRLNHQYIQTIKNQRTFSIKFIINHLHSLSSIIALYQQINDSTYVLNQNRDIQLVNIVSDTLKKYYPNSGPVKILWNDRVDLDKRFRSLELNYLGANAKKLPYPEISLPDVDGDTIYLTKIKGRCILIFFWNPASEDCILAMNGLKELYSDYKRKGFEVYNIALFENKQDWIDYDKTNKLPGISVLDQRAANSYYARIYNVHNLPASFLIGPDKEIIGKDIFGENLKNKLKEILK
jgi:peroxiredoxin